MNIYSRFLLKFFDIIKLYIQELLERKSSKTAVIFTHVSNKDLSKIKSPLDYISGQEVVGEDK